MASKLRPGIRVDEFLPIEDPDDQGTYETWWGRAWVHVKVSDPVKQFMLANELIGARLASALGLPTLPGEIAQDPDGKDCWVTPRVTSAAGTTPPPATPAVIAADHATVIAGMIAFDAWIHNIDRTEDNVLYDPRLGLWLIDHENSLAEPDGRGFETKPDVAAQTPLSGHGFAGEATDEQALRFWTQRIGIVSEHVIERPLDEANRRGLISKKEAAWLMRYLLARRNIIASLVPKRNLATRSQAAVVPNAHNEQQSLFDEPEVS